MVDFGSNYIHAMDEQPLEKIDIKPSQLGLSFGIGDPWQQLNAYIKAGASVVEIGFMGVGHGSLNNPTGVTPEVISKEKRVDIRDFAKVNDVKLSTHATANITGFSGFTGEAFSKQMERRNMEEVKKAIEFAADTAEGGAVVFHLGEFPRSIISADKRFEAFTGEEKQGIVAGLVDERTGQFVATLSRDREFPVKPKKDEKGNYIRDKQGNIQFEKWGYDTFIEEAKKQGKAPEFVFFEKLQQQQMDTASQEEKRAFMEAERTKEVAQNLREITDDIDQIRKRDPNKAWMKAWDAARSMGIAPAYGTSAYSEFQKDPYRWLDREKERYERETQQRFHAAEEAAKQRDKIQEDLKHVKPMSEYALQRTKENIAQTALYAYDQTKSHDFKRPIYLSPENLFPESGFGSHPEELKKIILDSRQEMAKRLMKERGMNETEAKETAKTHIRATFDIAHANIWRKYFKDDDADGTKFKKWLMDETKTLMKSGAVGHIHVSDNFGYQDEHMSPGSGNAPIQEFIKEVKSAGLSDEVIIEPGGHGGGQGDTIYDALFSGWKRFSNTPMYAVGKTNKTWEDVEGAYLTRTFSPKYMQGGYLIGAPEENWWDETGLE